MNQSEIYATCQCLGVYYGVFNDRITNTKELILEPLQTKPQAALLEELILSTECILSHENYTVQL